MYAVYTYMDFNDKTLIKAVLVHCSRRIIYRIIAHSHNRINTLQLSKLFFLRVIEPK